MPPRLISWLRSTCASYLRWWPTLACFSLSSQGLSRARQLSRSSCSGAPHSDAPAAGRVARDNAERHADNAAVAVVEAGGLGVEGNQLGCFETLEPLVELGLRGDRRVRAGRRAVRVRPARIRSLGRGLRARRRQLQQRVLLRQWLAHLHPAHAGRETPCARKARAGPRRPAVRERIIDIQRNRQVEIQPYGGQST